MIQVYNKSTCCGCSACIQICPKKCISFEEDCEGFRYPQVDTDTCIDCGLCEKVCPELAPLSSQQPHKVYAAINQDEEIRLASSSGGIFTHLAEQIIAKGGVVFGARFNKEWEVVHDYTETLDGLTAFRGSKYLQSKIGATYQQAEKFLKAGRDVLFSGTPCQIAGLKLFLRREYPNLLTVDFVCHGVPSPLAWRYYLNEQQKGSETTISTIHFRDKATGWKSYSLTLGDNQKGCIYTNRFYKDAYMQAFLANLTLRPSCYACPAKAGRSQSDITIGDFWGIEKIKPEIDDNKGVSLVMLNNNKEICDLSGCNLIAMTYKDASAGNPSILYSSSKSPYRHLFFRQLERSQSISSAYRICASKNFWTRLYRFMYRKFAL